LAVLVVTVPLVPAAAAVVLVAPQAAVVLAATAVQDWC
jgi:hypothetical protein